MKITDSTLSLHAAHTTAVRDLSRESLEVWGQGSEPEQRQIEGTAVGLLRQRAMTLLQEPPLKGVQSQETQTVQSLANGTERLDSVQEMEVSLLKLLVERFTGHRIQIVSPNDLRSEAESAGITDAPVRSPRAAQGEDWGLIYERSHSHYEAERTRFQAQGVVKTADGREISLSIELTMSREFLTEENMSIRGGDALKDPLVVNFSGTAAELTRQTYQFDIDADGIADQIHFLTPESGFLVLDRNQDGVVNDGSELFGALSGNGFADLAGYDSDGNGWIDGADPIFDKLRIWSKDADGRDQLVALGAKGIGAVYLGHIATPFEIRGQQNERLGVVRDSGLYLREDGEAGSVQQVDLVV